MEQARGARHQSLLEPVLHEVADHLEVAWIEHPTRGVAMPEPYENLTLKRGHAGEITPNTRSQTGCGPWVSRAEKARLSRVRLPRT